MRHWPLYAFDQVIHNLLVVFFYSKATTNRRKTENAQFLSSFYAADFDVAFVLFRFFPTNNHSQYTLYFFSTNLNFFT